MTRTSLLIISFLILACVNGLARGKKDNMKIVTDSVNTDSTEYELVIIDPGFETWLVSKPSKGYYSQSYYERMNRLYVSEWNYRYMARNKDEYDSLIDYDPKKDYGVDLNYKLYYYFKYFEEKNRTKLYPVGR